MLGKRRRRVEPAVVRPVFPAVPMMIVIFLLFAYHVALVRVGPVEGYIVFDYPKVNDRDEMIREQMRQRGIPIPPIYIVTVAAGPNGTVGELTIREEDNPAGGQPVGAGIDRYRAELTARWRALNGQPARVVLEIGEGVTYGTAVQLHDVGIQAGFENIMLFPANQRKR